MARVALLLFALQVLLPFACSDDKAKLDPQALIQSLAGGIVGGNQYDKGSSSSETHDNTNLSLNYDKKQGTSNQQSHDRGQAVGAAAGGVSAAYPSYFYHPRPSWGWNGWGQNGGWWGQPGWAQTPGWGGWGGQPVGWNTPRPTPGWGTTPGWTTTTTTPTTTTTTTPTTTTTTTTEAPTTTPGWTES